MQFQKAKDKIVIVDFGSQVTKLIARRIRELGVYSEIITPKEASKLKINFQNIKGIILSGGPSTVTGKNMKVYLSKFLTKKFQYLAFVMDYN